MPKITKSQRLFLEGCKWFVNNTLVIAHSTMSSHCTKRIDYNAKSHQRSNVSVIIWWRYFNYFHSTKAFFGYKTDEFQCLTRKETTWFRPASSWHKGGLNGINVITHVHCITSVPSSFQCHFSNFIDSKLFDIIHCKNVCSAFNHITNCCTRDLPSSNTNLNQIFGSNVGQVCSMKVGRCMHSFIKVFLLNVSMPINMNDTNTLGGNASYSPDSWKTNGMVSSKNDWKTPRCSYMGNCIGNLIKRFFNICRDSEYVTCVAKSHLLSKINAHFIIVRCV
mmetsp:Transcript_31225/g.45944  ORF Transcript_31225/g.45944 Transcript_31225/m.45944 type:complete len:278 (-) Transcript_31225:186-1019(-)